MKASMNYFGRAGDEVFDVRKAKSIKDEKMKELADKAKSKFESLTSSWKTEVKFTATETDKGWEIKTDNQVFHWLNGGTKSHIVTAPYGSAMQFKTGYTPKTSVGSLNVTGGGGGGVDFNTYSKGHMVKGIEPRRFDDEILKEIGNEISNASDWFKDL